MTENFLVLPAPEILRTLPPAEQALISWAWEAFGYGEEVDGKDRAPAITSLVEALCLLSFPVSDFDDVYWAVHEHEVGRERIQNLLKGKGLTPTFRAFLKDLLHDLGWFSALDQVDAEKALLKAAEDDGERGDSGI